MFFKLGALLDRISSKWSTTRPSSKPRTGARTRARAFSESGATATPPRALPTAAAAVTSAPSTTLVFPLSPRPNNALDNRPHVLSPSSRRVRFSSGSSMCTTHSKEEYDRSPIVDAPAGATHEGIHSPNKMRRGKERSPRAQKLEMFPTSISSPNLVSASPERRGADSRRERRPSLLMQSASRSFVAMSIAEEGAEEGPLVPMTRTKAERGQVRPRPKPRTCPSVDSARAICGGVVGRGVNGPYASSDEEVTPAKVRLPPQLPVPQNVGHHAGDSFLSLDYSDDEDIDEDTMFKHTRRASDRTQRMADALFFTMAAENNEKHVHERWETYGAAQTERKRDRARGRRSTQALLAAFPEPPKTIPSPLGARRHRDIEQWVRESAAASIEAVCDSAESSELGHGYGWHHAWETSTEDTTPEVTPPRARPKREHPPYDARTPPAKSCPALVAAHGGAGRRGGEKLLPLVPYDALEEPFRYERHPYASPALRAQGW